MTRGRKPKPWTHVCACGRPKHSRSKLCLMCDKQRRTRMVPIRICQWCGGKFRRKGHDPRTTHDVLRFCRKKCWGAFRSAFAQAEQEQYQRAREISRELTRAQRLYARSVCPCGAPITRPRGRFCNTCAATCRGRGIRRARAVGRRTGLAHLCPNCGRQFRGYERDVFCSQHCSHQYTKKQRYPSIGAMSLEQRNQIAELIALVRSARRRVHEELQPIESS